MQTKKQAQSKKSAVKFVAPAEHEQLLYEISGAIAAMGRRTTGQAFDLGIELARAKDVLPEKSFGKWVKQECGMTTRQAWNYVALPTYLGGYRERLENAGVVPTVMFVLASAEPVKVEEVLSVVESSQRLTVGQVKRLTKGETAKPAPAALGGALGFRRAAEAKAKAEADMFGKLAKIVLKALQKAAADIGAGKSVPKTKLAAEIELHCQKARALLSSAIEPVQSAGTTPVEWERARQIIGRLGDQPRWPGRSEFPIWIVEHALPALVFVVHGTPTVADVDEVADPEGDDVIEDIEMSSQVEKDEASSRPFETTATVPQPLPRLKLVQPVVSEPETEDVEDSDMR